MKIKLFEHQKEAIAKMHNGCILCGGVGSGKSLTSLGYYFDICGGSLEPWREMDPYKKMDLYIITTARKRDTNEWDKECLHFGISRNIILKKKNNKKEEPIEDETVKSPVNLVIDSWNNIGKYINVTNAFFIFDEQRVVGSGAWVKSFLKISKHNKWILLSATPGDTWMDYIPVFIANGFYKNRTEFIMEHVVYEPYTTFPKIKMYVNADKLLRLKKDVVVYMADNKTAKKEEITVRCEFDWKKFKNVNDSRTNPYTGEPIENAPQYCSCVRKLVFSDPSRVDNVIEILKEKKKAIIFYSYDFELEIMKERLEKENMVYAEWNGHAHEKIPKTDEWAYLVQYSSGCEGWNCVETDTIIFYSLSYSFRMFSQAMGRIDRLNTPYKVLYYYRCVSGSPLDHRMTQSLKRKEDFNERGFYEYYCK